MVHGSEVTVGSYFSLFRLPPPAQTTRRPSAPQRSKFPDPPITRGDREFATVPAGVLLVFRFKCRVATYRPNPSFYLPLSLSLFRAIFVFLFKILPALFRAPFGTLKAVLTVGYIYIKIINEIDILISQG